MGKSFRIERLNETIKELISEMVLSQIKDPRIGLVTITAVRVAADLSTAKVHFSVMGDEAVRAETRQGLVSARNFMRKTIARELHVRNAPELVFVYDDSLDRSMRIEEKLKEIHGEAPEGDASKDE